MKATKKKKQKKYVVTIEIPRPVWKEVNVLAHSKKEAIEAVKQDFWFVNSRQAYTEANPLPFGCHVTDASGDLYEQPVGEYNWKKHEPSVVQVDEINK